MGPTGWAELEGLRHRTGGARRTPPGPGSARRDVGVAAPFSGGPLCARQGRGRLAPSSAGMCATVTIGRLLLDFRLPLWIAFLGFLDSEIKQTVIRCATAEK